MIAYTFLLIAGIFAALSVNYYNRGTDHSQFRTIMNYVAIGVLGLLSVLAATVVLAPLLKDRTEKRKIAKAAKNKAKQEKKAEEKAAKEMVAEQRIAQAKAAEATKAAVKSEANLEQAHRQLQMNRLAADAARDQAKRLGSTRNPYNFTGKAQRAKNNMNVQYRR